MSNTAHKILFLGTGNSSASIMAEALLNSLGKARFRAWSAGSSPAGRVHAKAIETLKKHGIDTDELISKSWNNYSTQRFDLIVTVCDDIEDEIWPVFPGRPEIVHWNIPNLSEKTGIAAKNGETFEEAFLLLKEYVERLIHSHGKPSPPPEI